MHDVDLHRLSRMVLQSLQFTDVSSSVASTDTVSTFSGSLVPLTHSSAPGAALDPQHLEFGPDSYEA